MNRMFPIFAALLSLGSLRAGEALLSVDFNAGAKVSSATQDGFESFDVSAGDVTGPLAVSFPVSDKKNYPSGITVSVTAGKSEEDAGRLTGRDWKATQVDGGFPLADLYFDALCGATKDPFILTLSGLRPGQKYQLQIIAFSPRNSGTAKLEDVTSGDQADSAEIIWENEFQFSASTPEDTFLGNLDAKANTEGKVIVSISNPSGSPVLNGFRLSEKRP